MPVLLSDEELEALEGLPHLHRCLYIFGIRRYMDYQTSVTGIKRKISYKSLSEEIYVEPRRGVKEIKTRSVPQLKRAVKIIEQAGLIAMQSKVTKDEKQLIIKCLLAHSDKSAQNKAVPWPYQSPVLKAVPVNNTENSINTEVLAHQENESHTESRTTQNEKAVPHPVSDNCTDLHCTGEFDFLLPEEIPYFKLFQDLKLNVRAKNYLSAIAVAKALVKAQVTPETVSQAIKVKLKAYYEERGSNATTPVPDYFTDAIIEHHRKLEKIKNQPEETTNERPKRNTSPRYKPFETLVERAKRELEESAQERAESERPGKH